MAFLGSKKQVLIVGNDGLQLYAVKGKDVALQGDYSESGAALAKDLEKAFRLSGAPLVILFDVVEQQYRKEPIPKVSFMDRTKVINRKLQMAFPQQQMRAFMKLKQKPRDNESFVALFAGLSANPVSMQIMEALQASEISLQGVGLLPLESADLVVKMISTMHKRDKAASDTRWSVLMTHHKTGGLRQIIVKDGELALTRLTPLVVGLNDTQGLTAEIAREFNATLTYLSRFGYVPSDGLDLIMVSSAETCALLKNYRLQVTHLHALSIQDAAALIGMKPQVSADFGVYGEILHAAWNGAKMKLNVPLAWSAIDNIKNARQMARAAIVALLLGMGYMGYQTGLLHVDITEKENEIVGQKGKLIALQREHDDLAKKLNDLKYDPEKIRIMLAVHDKFAGKNLDLEPSFNALVPLIDRKSMRLQTLETVTPPEERNPAAAIPVPADPNAKPARQSAILNLKVGFLPGTSIEDGARMTNELSNRLKERFPGRSVSINNIVGDLSVDKTVKGISEQVTGGEAEGGLIKDETSSFTISGELE